ncbi:MAG: hypothetical protein AAGF94_14365 [Pseudomonadota bacterium]
MKEIVEALKGLAQFVTLAVTAIALATLVFAPEYFAARLANVLQALDREDISAKIKLPLLEAELARLGEEVTKGDEKLLAQAEAMAATGGRVSESVVLSEKGSWAVLSLSDTDLRAVRRAAATLQSEGFETTILQVGADFQAVALFDDRVAAETGAAVIEALQLSPVPPYVRSFAVWCANRVSSTDYPGVERCTST